MKFSYLAKKINWQKKKKKKKDGMAHTSANQVS